MSILQYFTKGKVCDTPNAKRSKLEDSDSDSSVSEGDINAETEPTTCREDDNNVSATAMLDKPTREVDLPTDATKKKQASAFCNDWCKGRESWLKYLPGQGMFCTLCQKHNKSPFSRGTWNTTPCTRLRLQSILAHEGCAAHKDALKLEGEQRTTTRIESALHPKIPARE